MSNRKTILAADLFCGAGGTSTGLLQAMDKLGLKVSLLAINHWKIAIETHSLNYPGVKHICDDLENIDPIKAVPSGKLRILVASPECIHFSNARGGKPVSKQSRATIKYVVKWLRNLDIADVLIENVREFQTFGPLHRTHSPGCEPKDGKCSDKKCHFGKPIKERKGQFFRAFIRCLVDLNYVVEWRMLCAADYGDTTSRRRLFIRASRKQNPIRWPAPTHADPKGKKKRQLPLFDKTLEFKPWRPARDIIDFTDLGTSIFNRGNKPPLSLNTIRRIETGLTKFSGLPFILPLEGFFRGNQPRSMDEPIPTVVASRGAGSVVQPFLLKSYLRSDAASIDAPVPTITAQVEHLAVVNPFMVKLYGNSDAGSVNAPLPTVTAQVNHLAVAQPFLVQCEHGGRVYSDDQPLPTITNRAGLGVVSPFILNARGGNDGYLRGVPVSEPIGALTGHPSQELVTPFILQMDEGGSLQSVDSPLRTITSADARALVTGWTIGYHGASYPGGDRARSLDEPLASLATANQHGLAFLVRFNGVGIGQSLDEPLKTITSKDRFALCVPWINEMYLLDIFLRMLKLSEMAAAHSFKKTYIFCGSREDGVKQVGNSVPVKLSEALITSIMDVNL